MTPENKFLIFNCFLNIVLYGLFIGFKREDTLRNIAILLVLLTSILFIIDIIMRTT